MEACETMKTLGIIPSMGPLAGTYFINRVLEFTPAKKEWEYFHILADYNMSIPSRTRALLYNEKSPVKETVNTINKLGEWGAHMVAIPCNSVHFWYKDVSDLIKIPWLNMIETVSSVVKKKNLTDVLVIGGYATVQGKLYDQYLDNTHYLSENDNKELYNLIEKLKLKGNDESLKKEFYNIVKPYENKVDGIVIACTEPSMLFGVDESCWHSFQIIDSTNEYAKKCVELCKEIKL